MTALSVGVFLPSMAQRGELPGDMAATAQHAEELGFESVWVIDQLVAGTGSPLLESGTALAVAAAATSRVRLGFGVMVLALRPLAWAAKQVASLQLVSGNRVVLGVGVGGDRHALSWAAAGVSAERRGRRTDEALGALPGLLTGEPTRLGDGPSAPVVQLSPPVPVPPIIVGGNSDAAMARAAKYGDGWFPIGLASDAVPTARARLGEMAAVRGRATPSVTTSIMVALSGDPSLPDESSLTRLLSDPDGLYAIPADHVAQVLVSGRPTTVAARLAEYKRADVERVVVTIVGGDWRHQAELLAEACALVK
jgi:alkanesulfonate monooxygenase SsuD/methylene tetrahydromethanopterin reductase-like flavin-dependent oxidoreductase (luciferase family)